MFPPIAVAEEILRAAAGALRLGDRAMLNAIDRLPVAVYATDLDGVLTYFNPHCILFAGRTPRVGRDRWCVSWKLYTEDGVFLPHDQCPMAVAVRDNVAIRGLRAVVERPGGVRAAFMPFPTPVVDADGRLLGAVNMLVDLTDREQAMFDGEYGGDFEPWHRAVIDRALASFSTTEVKALIAEMESEIDRQGPRLLN
jgi:PAS domain-containing protein